MPDLQLRVATADDLPAVAALWDKLQDFHRTLGLAFPETPDAAEKWLASFQRTLGRFSFLWVAGEKDGVKAFLLGRVKQTPPYLGGVQVGEISDLYVDEALRGSGVGAQLVQLAMDKFAELHVHSVEVQIQAGNEAGLAFWLKQDFKTDLTLVRKVL